MLIETLPNHGLAFSAPSGVGKAVAMTDLNDDNTLLAQIIARDERAFAQLAERYFSLIYRIAWRSLRDDGDAEDVAQEAMLRLWQQPEKLHDGRSIKAWLARVCRNLAIDHIRKKRPDLPGELPEVIDHADTPEGALHRVEASASIDEALASLPERQRIAVVLTYFEGFSNIETAAALEISVDAVESLLSRARRGLKQLLHTDYQALLLQLDQ